MTLISGQEILCDLGYDNLDKLILESLEISFNKEKYQFRAFSILEGQLYLNKLNIHEYNENPFIEFVYLPTNKIATIENFKEYDVRNIIVKNIDMNKIVDGKDELSIRRLKKEVCGIDDMIIEYIIGNEEIKEKIVSCIIENI